jgi:hypothetical protein
MLDDTSLSLLDVLHTALYAIFNGVFFTSSCVASNW